jgi:hypothetical protein
MADILDPKHEALVEHLFQRCLLVLGMPGFELRPLRRRKRGTGKFNSITYGYTKPGEKWVVIDLYTPKTMKVRKTDAILRVIAHELAHHQKPPKYYRQWVYGKIHDSSSAVFGLNIRKMLPNLSKMRYYRFTL